MCGKKIPSADAKFCMGCGLNLVEYRQKLERLAKNETPPKTTLSRETNAAPKKSAETTSTCSQVNEPQDLVHSLYERFGYLRQVYFNVSGKKNSTKIQSAVNAYASKAANEQIIFVLDDTLFGGGEDGFLVTTENIYVHNISAKAFVVPWREVQTFDHTFNPSSQCISINGGQKILLSGYSQVELKTLIELLYELKTALGGQSVPKKISSSPRQNTHFAPRKRYFTLDNYVCDNPEAERIYQIAKQQNRKFGNSEYLRYLALALNKGHAKAAYDFSINIALMYNQSPRKMEALLNDIGIWADVGETIVFFLTRAAKGGLVDAMEFLGDFYLEGTFGKTDFDMALDWYEKVLQSGCELKNLSEIKGRVIQLRHLTQA